MIGLKLGFRDKIRTPSLTAIRIDSHNFIEESRALRPFSHVTVPYCILLLYIIIVLYWLEMTLVRKLTNEWFHFI